MPHVNCLLQQKTGSLICYLLTLGLALMLFGCATTTRDWQTASRQGTIEAYEKFLLDHPDADQVSEARRRMAELRADKDWRNAKSIHTIIGYKDFLDKYPLSKHAREASTQLELLESESDWEQTKSIGTIPSYSAFIKKHPTAKQISEAKQGLNRLESQRDWEAAQEMNSVRAYEEFLQNHSSSQYSSEAKNRLTVLQAEEAWKTAANKNTDSDWINFIVKYSNSPKAEDAIVKLKNHKAIRAGGLIPWATLGGKTIELDEKNSNLEGALVENLTTIRLPGIPVTFNCNDRSGFVFPNWVKLGPVLCTGRLKGSSEGLSIVSGMALIPLSR